MSHSVPDKEALTSVWEAVKNRSIPLKSLTKAEYDVLDETSKNSDVVYLVQKPGDEDQDFSDKPSDIYSTEETRIGTWIDGKPLYRKCYNVLTPNSQTATSQTVVELDFSVEYVAKCIALVSSSSYAVNAQLAQAPYNDQSDFVWVACNTVYNPSYPNRIQMKVSSSMVSREATVILEYTKTTE